MVTETFENILEGFQTLNQKNKPNEEPSVKPINKVKAHYDWMKTNEFQTIANFEKQTLKLKNFEFENENWIQAAESNGGITRPYSKNGNPVFDEDQCKKLFPSITHAVEKILETAKSRKNFSNLCRVEDAVNE